jgi:hypothetical protein
MWAGYSPIAPIELANGVDAHRILLLTFSRRAAVDMTGRVKRITAAVLGTSQIDLPWAGTFHAVGARILREYAHRTGLQPSFTILDRSDAADLMDLVRHDLELSNKKSRFPRKDTCLAIYSLAINSGAPLKPVLNERFPWCVEWKNDLRLRLECAPRCVTPRETCLQLGRGLRIAAREQDDVMSERDQFVIFAIFMPNPIWNPDLALHAAQSLACRADANGTLRHRANLDLGSARLSLPRARSVSCPLLNQ